MNHFFRPTLSLVFLTALTACGSHPEQSLLKGLYTQCEAKQELKETGDVLKAGIDFFIATLANFIPPLSAVTSVLPIDMGLEHIFGSLFTGCDTTAAKIDWFIHAAEERFAALHERLDRVEFESIKRDLSSGAGRMDGQIGVIAQKLEEIAVSYDPKSQEIDTYLLSDAKDRYLELAHHFAQLAVQVRDTQSLAYVSGLYQTAIPCGLAAAFHGDQLLSVLTAASASNPATVRQTRDNIQLFKQNFGDFLHSIEQKKTYAADVSFEISHLPDFFAEAGATRESDARSTYRLNFPDEAPLRYRIRAFGQVVHEGSLATQGKWLNVELKTLPLAEDELDEHPQIMSAVSASLIHTHAEIGLRIEAARLLYDAIDLRSFPDLKKKLGWTESGTFPMFRPLLSRPEAPWGSAFQGQSFDDESALSTARVEEISLDSDRQLWRLCSKYEGARSICHGKRAGEKKTLRLDADEFITRVAVTAEPWQDYGSGLRFTRIVGLTIGTSKGRTLEGGRKGKGAATQVFEAAAGWQIAGWFGREGNAIESLAPIYSRRPPLSAIERSEK